MIIRSTPASTYSQMTYTSAGIRPIGKSSLGITLLAGHILVACPAAAMTPTEMRRADSGIMLEQIPGKHWISCAKRHRTAEQSGPRGRLYKPKLPLSATPSREIITTLPVSSCCPVAALTRGLEPVREEPEKRRIGFRAALACRGPSSCAALRPSACAARAIDRWSRHCAARRSFR
jgi:hypothetical protein